jgi:hypothetical protein
MEEVTAGVCLVSISQSRYSAVYNGGHAKTVFLHAAISAAAHQTCGMLMNVNFRICRDERSELKYLPSRYEEPGWWGAASTQYRTESQFGVSKLPSARVSGAVLSSSHIRTAEILTGRGPADSGA